MGEMLYQTNRAEMEKAGRLAFHNGKTREEGHCVSPSSMHRQAWFRGWDEEAELDDPYDTPSQSEIAHVAEPPKDKGRAGFIRAVHAEKWWAAPGWGHVGSLDEAHVYYENDLPDYYCPEDDDNRFILMSETPAFNRITETSDAGLKFTNAVDFINAAAAAVGGPRRETHGDMGTCFMIMAEADYFLTQIAAIADQDMPEGLKPALRMILYKIARIYAGSYNPDDYVDIAGYAGCAGEVAAMHHHYEPAVSLDETEDDG